VGICALFPLGVDVHAVLIATVLSLTGCGSKDLPAPPADDDTGSAAVNDTDTGPVNDTDTGSVSDTDTAPTETGDTAPPEDTEDTEDTGPIDADGDGSPASEDCDDDPLTGVDIHPGAPEICDGIDNDCDGDIDDDDDDRVDAPTWYPDADADGYADESGAVIACDAPKQHIAEPLGDCDDTDAAINPGAAEACDGVDNDCDATTVEAGAVFTPTGGAGVDISADLTGLPVSPASWSSSEDGTLSLCGETWYAALTISHDVAVVGSEGALLNAGGSAQVVTIEPGASVVSIENVDITGGVGESGGGVACATAAALTMSDLDIYENSATYGGGVHITGDCSATLTDLAIYENDAFYGGGLELDTAEVVLQSSHIHSNYANYSGGGVRTQGVSTMTITDSEIYDNVTIGGGGIFIWSGVVTITDSLIYGNDASAGGAGGGLSLDYDNSRNPCSVELVDTLVTDNIAYDGGGVHVYDGATFTCRSTKKGLGGITGNSAVSDGGAGHINSSGQIISEGCDWGTDAGGDNNSPNDFSRQVTDGEYGDAEYFTCEYGGCY